VQSNAEELSPARQQTQVHRAAEFRHQDRKVDSRRSSRGDIPDNVS